jgi:hypothetical protein
MRIYWSALAITLFQTCCNAQEMVHIDGAQIIKFGIVDAEIKRRIEDPSFVSGSKRKIADIKFRQSTDQIPARRGIQFGYQFRINGEPAGATVPVNFVLKFPEAGLKNPRTGETQFRQEFTQDRTIGDVHFRGYGFDHAWEAVSGVWTFEIWYADRKIGEQRFTVVKGK